MAMNAVMRLLTIHNWRQGLNGARNLVKLHDSRGFPASGLIRLMTTGYDPDFLGLGFQVPLPKPSDDLLPHIFEQDGKVRQIKHPHWSAIIDTRESRRCAAVVGLNINGKLLKTVAGKNWRKEDPSVLPYEYQLGNEYYVKTLWDKGHLARRASAAWGETVEEAQAASKETFFYTNACLQHANFNDDEWAALEESVQRLSVKEGKTSVFQGPIFSKTARQRIYVTPPGLPPVRVPSGFFKVVCGKTNTGDLAVRAFIITQMEYSGVSESDPLPFKDVHPKKKPTIKKLELYQVCVTHIEEETGLDFGEKIRHANPLFFSDSEDTAEDRKSAGVTTCPEVIPIRGPDDVVGPGEKRPQAENGTQGLRILAALVNAEGRHERGQEWVSIMNLSAQPQPLEGWKIRVNDLESELPSVSLPPGEAFRVQKESLVLPNSGGHIQLFHRGSRMHDVRYSGKDVSKNGENSVLIFNPESI